MHLLPAILTDSLQTAQERVNAYATWEPRPTTLHIDIIDGEFADNLTIDPGDLGKIGWQDFELDLHLMTIEPVDAIDTLRALTLENPSNSQTTIRIRQVIGQVERMSSQAEFVQLAHEAGWKAALALDHYTPVSAIEPDSLKQLDALYIMGAHVGRQGQAFQPRALDVLQEAASVRAEAQLSFILGIDIGMTDQTIPLAVQSGAQEVAVGSYLNAEDGAQRWAELHKRWAGLHKR